MPPVSPNALNADQAFPKPLPFSNAVCSFSRNLIFVAYSGRRSRPKHVRLVGRRCRARLVSDISIGAAAAITHLAVRPVPLDDKLYTWHPTRRDPVARGHKLQQLAPLFSRIAVGNTPEVFDDPVAATVAIFVLGRLLQGSDINRLRPLDHRS